MMRYTVALPADAIPEAAAAIEAAGFDACYVTDHPYPPTSWVDEGGLMAYAPRVADNWRRVAYYVDRILKGTKPADLPVEQPMTFDFVVNLKTARELGITFPNEIMLQVTEVIQ